jgi:hypothetical protein
MPHPAGMDVVGGRGGGMLLLGAKESHEGG